MGKPTTQIILLIIVYLINMIKLLNFFDYEKMFYLISVIGATVGFAGIIWNKIVKKSYIKIKEKYIYLESLILKIDEISKEFVPNHGSSMKDAITKIQNELSKNTDISEKVLIKIKWLLDNGDIPVFESDNEGKCIWANTAYLNLIKRDLNSILGHGWKNIVSEEDRGRVVHNWEVCVKDGINSEDTYHIVDAAGNKIKVFTVASKTGKFGYIGALRIIKE